MRSPEGLRGLSWWRLWTIQGSFHPGRMQSLGWMVAILGVWRRRGLTPEQMAARLSAEPTSSNTHPYLVGLALGTRLRLEDGGDSESGGRSAEALARVLGGLGDRFFWVAMIPAVVALALGLLLVAGPWSVLVLWLGFAAVLTWFRRRLLLEGYRRGMQVAELLENPAIDATIRVLQWLGVVLVGLAGARLLATTTELPSAELRSLLVFAVAAAWGSVAAWRRWSLQWWAVGVVLVAWADAAMKAWGNP